MCACCRIGSSIREGPGTRTQDLPTRIDFVKGRPRQKQHSGGSKCTIPTRIVPLETASGRGPGPHIHKLPTEIALVKGTPRQKLHPGRRGIGYRRRCSFNMQIGFGSSIWVRPAGSGYDMSAWKSAESTAMGVQMSVFNACSIGIALLEAPFGGAAGKETNDCQHGTAQSMLQSLGGIASHKGTLQGIRRVNGPRLCRS